MILEYSIPARLSIGISLLVDLCGLVEASTHASLLMMRGTEFVAIFFSGIGCMLYTKSKGYNPLLGILGFAPIFPPIYGAPGLLVMCLLKDRKPELKRP